MRGGKRRKRKKDDNMEKKVGAKKEMERNKEVVRQKIEKKKSQSEIKTNEIICHTKKNISFKQYFYVRSNDSKIFVFLI